MSDTLLLDQNYDTASKTMKSIPKEERPYEKCLAHGAGVLSDAELLAVILRTGSKGESALELSRKVLAQHGEGSGLLGIYHMSISDLTRVKGLGKVKAIQLKCVAELSKRISRQTFSDGISFKDPAAVARYYMEEMRHQEQEILMLAMLNSKGLLIADQVISKGTVRAAMSSPREIFIEAVRHHAVSIILLHNHPSGIPDPSREDILMTRRVRDAGRLLGIELLDHIIIGDCQAVSMREQGIWQE
ncbi:MAG: DNA repair protein RadC [Lachnospiraceae bacterium]|mgnify:CR=1 FL=1|jgi:DNA repair protein RadC|nr:DNA repair protein RadC [Lachnospiraceae bacterium]RKJ50043.1 JAB domain-containing protein [bacterium 1XD42-54]